MRTIKNYPAEISRVHNCLIHENVPTHLCILQGTYKNLSKECLLTKLIIPLSRTAKD